MFWLVQLISYTFESVWWSQHPVAVCVLASSMQKASASIPPDWILTFLQNHVMKGFTQCKYMHGATNPFFSLTVRVSCYLFFIVLTFPYLVVFPHLLCPLLYLHCYIPPIYLHVSFNLLLMMRLVVSKRTSRSTWY